MKSATILITGGTGSFGQTMARHLLSRGAKEIRVFSRDEWKQNEMRDCFQEDRLKFYIGDVRDRASVDNAMDGVDLVFHAAALKQVPSCEFFPMQAVATNIQGTHNVVESAIAHSVKSAVCLGTDKAVAPVNAMGMTKALMEKVVQSASRRLSRNETVLTSVRYGNVMCSRGSVIPLFIRQIREGKPLTITNPKMTRFMMPLRDSVALVDFAFEHGNQGDVFVKKSPASTIRILAEALKELFNSDAQIQQIGTRHGEKIHETLASREELLRAEDLGDYFRIRIDGRDLNYQKFFSEGEMKTDPRENYDSSNTEQLDVAKMKELLLTLPEIQEELKS
jgi:UDP-N-acetylglucosamine 4,6-dehydratase/5-epimerase